MNDFTLSIGIIVILIGLAIIALTIVFLRENQVKNIHTGIVFTLLGASIIWLDFQEGGTFHINIGISDKLSGLLLIGFVMSLFILKGVLDIREGSKNLQDKTISSFMALLSKFQIIVAIIMTTFVCFILLVAFTKFGR